MLEEEWRRPENWDEFVRMEAYRATWERIQKKDLLERTTDTGAFLKVELERVRRQQRCIDNIRGQGTFIGFDVEGGHRGMRKLIRWCVRHGVHVSPCGDETIGLRPALILEQIHAAFLRDALLYFRSTNDI